MVKKEEINREISSGIKIKPVYTPEDVRGIDYEKEIGNPGEYPYTRGPYPLMYQENPWLIRQYTGFSCGEDTNARLKSLIQTGVTGISIAFSLSTQMGLDSDHPLAEDEVGRVGVAIDTLKDMETLFKDIPLSEVNTNMTINAVASIILAMYVSAAEKQGVPHDQIRATIQNDILKEYIARGAWIFPLKPSMRLISDVVEFCQRELPRVNAISVSPAHMRFAGATAAQEAAYALLIADAYIRQVLERAINIDDFAHQITFTFGSGMNIFEEVAKYRALRRLWAKRLRERFNAKQARSMLFRTLGGGGQQELTMRQPENNIIRGSFITLAAALGGVQAMSVTPYDEAYTIPSLRSQQLAVRTSQILIEECGLTDTVDPLAGSYYVEWLTNEMERKINEIVEEVEKTGGIVPAIESGEIQRQIAKQAYLEQQQIESGEKVKVGVNKYRTEEEADIDLHKYDPAVRDLQIERLRKAKAERDNSKVERALKELARVADSDENLMPYIVRAVKCYATVGEITSVFRERFGAFKEPAVF